METYPNTRRFSPTDDENSLFSLLKLKKKVVCRRIIAPSTKPSPSKTS